MRSSFRLGAAALCGLALLAFGGRQSSAGTTFAASGSNSSPYLAHLIGVPNGPIDDPASDFFSKQNISGAEASVGATATAPFFKSYCIDLYQGVMQKIVDVASVSTTAGTALDSKGNTINLGAAGWIINNFGVNLGVINTSAKWAALEASAGVNPANVTYLEQVAVLQSGVWAKAYSATSVSIVGSEGGSTNADANSLLTQLLALTGSNTSTIGLIGYPPTNPSSGAFNNQNQLFTPPGGANVPEPSSLALLGLGALGVLGGYSWKRRNHP